MPFTAVALLLLLSFLSAVMSSTVPLSDRPGTGEGHHEFIGKWAKTAHDSCARENAAKNSLEVPMRRK